MLPGQTLNVLEVPEDSKLRPGHTRSSSSISFSISAQTLVPEDRFVSPVPVAAPPKPRLPRLITPASSNVSNAMATSFAAKKGRPWTAAAYVANHTTAEFPVAERGIKSASCSPTADKWVDVDIIDSAFPASAPTPSKGGRGRSRVLHSTNDRTERTHDPSHRELRRNQPLSTSSVWTPTWTPLPTDTLSPMEQTADSISLLPELWTASLNRLVRDVVELSSPLDPVDNFPDSQSLRTRGRSLSPEGRRCSGRSTRETRNRDGRSSRRSSSLGQSRREPSPLRHVLLQASVQENMSSRIPEDIAEAEHEDPVFAEPEDFYIPGHSAARQFSQNSEEHVESFNVTSEDAPKLADHLWQTSLATIPAKETQGVNFLLPELDSLPEPQDFSMWTPGSPQYAYSNQPESLASDNVENSPTFSSVKDIESGACTPHQAISSNTERSYLSIYQPDDMSTVADSDDGDAAMEAEYEAHANNKTPTAASFLFGDSSETINAVSCPDTLMGRPNDEAHITQTQRLLYDFEYLRTALQ